MEPHAGFYTTSRDVTLALRYLFNLDEAEKWTPANILNLAEPDPQTNPPTNQNDPQESFQQHQVIVSGPAGQPGVSWWEVALGVVTGGASLATEATVQAAIDVYKRFSENERKIMWSSGFDTAVRTKASALFATLAFFNAMAHESVPDPNDPNADPNDPNFVKISILDAGDNAIFLAMALASDLQLQWDKLYPDPLKSDELHAMMSSRNFTEVFRRVPGFIAMIREIVRPLVEPAGADSQAIAAHNQDVFTLARLVGHLNDYSTHYTERFLHYLADATSNQAIVDFATQAIRNENLVFSFDFDPNDFDPDRAFLIRREIVLPAVAVLDKAALSKMWSALGGNGEAAGVPVATVEEIETPCEGVHFEVVPGKCVLDAVPTETTFPASVSGLTIAVP